MPVLFKDIAEKANISATTVSRYYNKSGYVSAEKIALIEEAAAELGFSHEIGSSDTSVGMRASKSKGRCIGALFNSAFSDKPIYLKHMHAIVQEASKRELYVLMQTDSLDNDALVSAVSRFEKMSVLGIIISGFNETYMNESTADKLKSSSVPVIALERTGQRRDINRVHIDNFEAANLAANALISAGHRHITYIGVSSEHEEERARLSGYYASINSSSALGISGSVSFSTSLEIQDGVLAFKHALAEDPKLTGIITWSDVYAAGILQYLDTIGKRVPEDISIVSIDDAESPLLSPPITSVALPIEEMAAAAIDMILLGTSDVPRAITLTPRIISRSSVKRLEGE